MLPLFFQVVLLDSATTAGARLAIPSLATPIGGVVAGVVMSRYGRLAALVRAGAILMAVGNALVAGLRFEDDLWKYYVYIFPANLGQGIVYPGILFTSLATFEHAGQSENDISLVPVSLRKGTWGKGGSKTLFVFLADIVPEQITPCAPRPSTSSDPSAPSGACRLLPPSCRRR